MAERGTGALKGLVSAFTTAELQRQESRRQREKDAQEFYRTLVKAGIELEAQERRLTREQEFTAEQNQLNRESALERAKIGKDPLSNPMMQFLAFQNPEFAQMLMQQQIQTQQPTLQQLPATGQPTLQQPAIMGQATLQQPIRPSITGGIRPQTPVPTDFVAGGIRGSLDPEGRVAAQQAVTKEQFSTANRVKRAIRQIDSLAQERDVAFPASESPFIQRNIKGPFQEFGAKTGVFGPEEAFGFQEDLPTRAFPILEDLGADQRFNQQQLTAAVASLLKTRSAGGERLSAESGIINQLLSKLNPQERAEVLADPEIAQIMQRVSQGSMIGQTVPLDDGSTATIIKVLQ